MIKKLFTDDNLKIISMFSIIGIFLVILGWILVLSSGNKHYNNLIKYGVRSPHWWVKEVRNSPGIPGKSQGYIDVTIKYEIRDGSILESTVALLPWDYEDYRKNTNNYDSEFYKEQKLLYLPSDPKKVLFYPYQKIRRDNYVGGKIVFYGGIVLTLVGLIIPHGVKVFSKGRFN